MKGLLPVLLAVLVLGGCSGSSDDGIKPENQVALTDANQLAHKVGGDYSKLTADEKKQFLKMVNGNEAQAKAICSMMVNSPNAGVMQGHGVAGQKN